MSLTGGNGEYENVVRVEREREIERTSGCRERRRKGTCVIE